MSFVVKSVELKNIRTHEYFLFEPALTGVTAISGPNGAGKSTIVDSLAWSLFGTRPSGVRNKNLIRSKVDPKEKPVSVKSIILIGGIEYAVERKIITKDGTTECNVWGKTEEKDGFKHVAGPSVTHVEKFIRNEMGMNEKGFLTSVFVQQKQVDQIVSATPRERGAVIEELTGISSITQAIAKKNENTRALEKAASIFQIGNIDEAKEKVKKQEIICSDLETKEKETLLKFQQTKDELKESKENFEVESKKLKEKTSLTQAIDNLNIQIEMSKKQADDDLKYILEFKEKYGTTIAIDTSKQRQEVSDKRNEIQKLEFEMKSVSNDLTESTKNHEACLILKGDFKTQKSALSKIEEIEKEIQLKEEKTKELIAKESMLTSEIKHSKKAKEHITGEHKNCPVCKGDIKDPKELKEQIEQEIKAFESEKKETKELLVEISKEIESLNVKLKETKVSLEALKNEKVFSSKMKESKERLKEISDKIDILKVELKSLEDAYEKALRVEADKKALDSAKERSLTINQVIHEKEEKVKSLKEKVKELNCLPERSFLALEKKVQDLSDKLSKLSVSGQSVFERRKLENERLQDYKKNLETVKEAMEKYNQLAKEIQVSIGSSNVLSLFKAERIESSIPTLEFYASDFLFKFTGGDFAKLSVDKKFNTFVTTSGGDVYPVSQLSGGELSSAAIALRLGIAMLLNNSDKSALILDEVLVSMDEDRSRQIMETISSMTNSQVIFIAHNTDINSIADKTVIVNK